jgi:hypothetical protein
MILFGEDALRNAVFEFLAHYHGERNHHGWGNCADHAIDCDGANSRTSATQAAVGWRAELLPPSGGVKFARTNWKEGKTPSVAARRKPMPALVLMRYPFAVVTMRMIGFFLSWFLFLPSKRAYPSVRWRIWLELSRL